MGVRYASSWVRGACERRVVAFHCGAVGALGGEGMALLSFEGVMSEHDSGMTLG